MKLTAEPIPVPPASGAAILLINYLCLSSQSDMLIQRMLFRLAQGPVLKNLFAVTPYPRALAFAIWIDE